MVRYVLTADYTLMSDYRGIPLATFFSCLTSDFWTSRVAFRALANPPKLGEDGLPLRAPYGLRKIEAALVQAVGRSNVVVADPRTLDRHIGPDTEIVGIHTMDPLGLGPVSMTFTYGGLYTPYTKAMFLDAVRRAARPGRRYRIVVGGPGVWQFDVRPGVQEALGIDHIVHGESEHLVYSLFQRVAAGAADPVTRHANRDAPRIDQMPRILKPTINSMVEVMRGCGRGCEFCEVTLRRPRYFPLDYIADEVGQNTRVGPTSIQLQSDDIFLYRLENWRTMEPNEDAVRELFAHVMAQPGVTLVYPTHGTLSAVVTNPGLIADFAKISRAGPGRFLGIQAGIETGSQRLSKVIMPRKAAPFAAEEWPDVVVEGTEILNRNYWWPAYTLIVGLPGETSEDAWATVDLIDRLEQIPDGHFIMSAQTFVPVGRLKEDGFFDVQTMLDEARFNVIYRAWRHNALEIRRNLWKMMKLPGPLRAAMLVLGRLGSVYMQGRIRRWGERQGYRVRPPARTVRQAEGHTRTYPAG